MRTKKNTALLAIGQLAFDYHVATTDAYYTKCLYHLRCDEFEFSVRVLPSGRIDKWDPKNSDFIDFTMEEYRVQQDYKRIAYNAKRRLNTACQRYKNLLYGKAK